MVLLILVGLLALDAVILVVAIILQPRSQGGGLGAAFGGSAGAGAFFGGRGGMEFLTKLTAVLCVVFVILIMAVNFYIGAPKNSGNTMQRGGGVPASAPANPAGGTPQPAGN